MPTQHPQPKSPCAPSFDDCADGNCILIGIPLWECFDSLDVVGPYQVFNFLGKLPNGKTVKPCLVGPSAANVLSGEGIEIKPHFTFENCPPLDIIYVPGGSNVCFGVLRHGPVETNSYLKFLRAQVLRTDPKPIQMTVSVCTGALLLAAAGLLEGRRATTHWQYKAVLAMFPGVEVAEAYPRWLIDGNVITGGGISSGIDQALKIASILGGDHAAQTVQLSMQYAPKPPFQAGDPCQADPALVAELKTNWKPDIEALMRAVQDFLEHRPVSCS